jgi:hypothetical protein
MFTEISGRLRRVPFVLVTHVINLSLDRSFRKNTGCDVSRYRVFECTRQSQRIISA